MAKQKELDLHPVNGEKREGLLVIIKPGREARYKQVVDILDEMEIYQVKKYCLVGVGEEETRFMQ